MYVLVLELSVQSEAQTVSSCFCGGVASDAGSREQCEPGRDGYEECRLPGGLVI